MPAFASKGSPLSSGIPLNTSRLPTLLLSTLRDVDLRAAEKGRVDSLLAQPKRVAMLTWLATSAPPGSFHPRDKLLGLFWPDFDDERARNSLRTALHYLRRSLGPGVVVSRSDGAIGIDQRRFECDVWHLEAALDEGRWSDIGELYPGDFLDGFHVEGLPEFEHWTESRRSQLRRAVANALLDRSIELENRGLVSEAVEVVRRGMTLLPASEIAVQRLVTLLERVGDRAAARMEYERFAARLRERYDLEPTPETRALLANMEEDREAETPVSAPVPEPSPQPAEKVEGSGPAAPVPVPSRRPRAVWNRQRTSFAAVGAVAIGMLAFSGVDRLGSAPGEDVEVVSGSALAVAPIGVVGPVPGGADAGRVVAELLAMELVGASLGRILSPTMLWESGSGFVSRDDARRAVRSAGAERLLGGSLVLVDRELRLVLVLTGTGPGEPTLGSWSLTGSPDSLSALAHRAALQVADHLREPAVPGRHPP